MNGFEFGYIEDGKPGYREAGADTFHSFKSIVEGQRFVIYNPVTREVASNFADIDHDTKITVISGGGNGYAELFAYKISDGALVELTSPYVYNDSETFNFDSTIYNKIELRSSGIASGTVVAVAIWD